MAPLRTLGLSAPVTTALDPEVWRKHYAFGIPLGPDGGAGFQSYADLCGGDCKKLETALANLDPDTIRWHLRVAMSELQSKLGIPLGIVVVKSPPLDDGMIQGVHYDRLHARRPYTHGEAQDWYKIVVAGPVISVERVRAYYYGQLIWEFSSARDNIDLVRVEWPTQGEMHILPINFQSVIVTQGPNGGPGNYGVWHTLGAHRSPVPDFWAVDYTEGPIDKETGTVAHLELVLINWIMLAASIPLLALGATSRTRGVVSTSVSFDGLSRSVGLAASASTTLYQALTETYSKLMDRIDWKQLRSRKRGIRVRKFSH